MSISSSLPSAFVVLIMFGPYFLYQFDKAAWQWYSAAIVACGRGGAGAGRGEGAPGKHGEEDKAPLRT
jgi:hypothetical protein